MAKQTKSIARKPARKRPTKKPRNVALSNPPVYPHPSMGSPSQCSSTGYCIYKYSKSVKQLIRFDFGGAGECSSGVNSGPSSISDLTSLEIALLDYIFTLDPDRRYYACCGVEATA